MLDTTPINSRILVSQFDKNSNKLTGEPFFVETDLIYVEGGKDPLFLVISEKVKLTTLEKEEDDGMHASELKKVLKLAGIEKALEDGKEVPNFQGTLTGEITESSSKFGIIGVFENSRDPSSIAYGRAEDAYSRAVEDLIELLEYRLKNFDTYCNPDDYIEDIKKEVAIDMRRVNARDAWINILLGYVFDIFDDCATEDLYVIDPTTDDYIRTDVISQSQRFSMISEALIKWLKANEQKYDFKLPDGVTADAIVSYGKREGIILESGGKIEEGKNYHSIFIKDGNKWVHHFDADNAEDAKEEMDSLRRSGEKVKKVVVPKEYANWTNPEHLEMAIRKLDGKPAKKVNEQDHPVFDIEGWVVFGVDQIGRNALSKSDLAKTIFFDKDGYMKVPTEHFSEVEDIVDNAGGVLKLKNTQKTFESRKSSFSEYDKLVFKMIAERMNKGMSAEEIAEDLALDKDQTEIIYEKLQEIKKARILEEIDPQEITDRVDTMRMSRKFQNTPLKDIFEILGIQYGISPNQIRNMYFKGESKIKLR
ncbi:MAG TPA: hypothetical protein VIK67_02460 [Acholeplasma sp.]